MSVKSSKPLKEMKLARYGIDILAIYASENENPVSLDAAMAKIYEVLSQKKGTSKLKIQKCILQIWGGSTGSHNIIIKNHNKAVVERFTTKSMGMPQIGQLGNQDLVFLPVLNKDYKSELFVFHPNTATAQEIVIKLVKLLQMNDPPGDYYKPVSPSPPKSHTEESIHILPPDLEEPRSLPPLENGNTRSVSVRPSIVDQEDVHSEYSLSSNFFNNWYCKVEQMVSHAPTSLYQGSEYGSSINDDLQILNQYLKEIRAFMNSFYDIMHDSIRDASIKNDTVHRVVKLPPRASFIEIAQKIKYSLNIASVHENLIHNPTSKEIVNQLLLILRILSDATTDKQTMQHDLVKGVKEPIIIDTAVKYLTDNLNKSNKEFWMGLGKHYGYIPNTAPLGLQRTMIDEFEIRRDLLKPDNHQETPRRNGNSPERLPQRNYEPSIDRKPYRAPDRYTDRNPYKQYSSDNDLRYDDDFPRKKMVMSHPQLYIPERRRSIEDLEDDHIFRGYPRSDFTVPELTPHQKPDRPIPNGNGYTPQNSFTWTNSQNRFIDAVLLRNGKLLKITRDRPAQNAREIAVTFDEAVEFLTDYGDTVMVKNAMGETGYCPSSVVQPM